MAADKIKAHEKELIVKYLNTILDNAQKCHDSQARLALKHAAQNVASHLAGEDMTDIFVKVIDRYKSQPTQ